MNRTKAKKLAASVIKTGDPVAGGRLIEAALNAETDACASLAEKHLATAEGGEAWIARKIVGAIRGRKERAFLRP